MDKSDLTAPVPTPASTPALLPCPFCGSSPRHLKGKAGFYTERVICDQCEFHLPPEAWSQRSASAHTAALQASHARLLSALNRSLSWLTSYPGGGTMGPTGPYEQACAAIAAAPEAKP